MKGCLWMPLNPLQLKSFLSLLSLTPFPSPTPLSISHSHLFPYHCTARRGERQTWVLLIIIYCYYNEGRKVMWHWHEMYLFVIWHKPNWFAILFQFFLVIKSEMCAAIQQSGNRVVWNIWIPIWTQFWCGPVSCREDSEPGVGYPKASSSHGTHARLWCSVQKCISEVLSSGGLVTKYLYSSVKWPVTTTLSWCTTSEGCLHILTLSEEKHLHSLVECGGPKVPRK